MTRLEDWRAGFIRGEVAVEVVAEGTVVTLIWADNGVSFTTTAGALTLGEAVDEVLAQYEKVMEELQGE